MRFELFLRSLDMGRCEDQLQRQALLDLATLFVAIDGDVKESEETVITNWLADIPWNSDASAEQYYRRSMEKAREVLKLGDVEDYIQHHANLLIDQDTKDQALKLAEAIAHADNELDDAEANAIAMLKKALA